MSESLPPQAKEIRTLRDAFGTEIVLSEDNGESSVYHLLYEFALGDQPYAALLPEFGDKDEPMFFRIGRGERGEPELESIHDEDEWETVSEIYDEWAFPLREEV